jgi:hypothetical protein
VGADIPVEQSAASQGVIGHSSKSFHHEALAVVFSFLTLAPARLKMAAQRLSATHSRPVRS